MDKKAPPQLRTRAYPLLWKVALSCFLLAALTGFMYRLGMIGWLPASLGLALDNIRHAHSHLMFFGWAVPFPLYILFAHLVDKDNAKHRAFSWMKYALSGTLIFGLLAYPFFLFYGYRPVEIGSADLPLSVILSGLVMICWYAFLWGYLKMRGVLNDASKPWFDGALVMLFVCSLGAWGVAVLQALDPGNHLFMKSMTHFFLATFTEGWVVLILVAILVKYLKIEKQDWPIAPNMLLGCIAIGAPLTFPYGISESLLTSELLMVARIGGSITAVGLLGVVYALVSSGKWKKSLLSWVVGLLAFKAIMQLTASVLPSSFWLSDHALRIFYLHVLLLGALTTTISGWLQHHAPISKSYYYAVVVSILAVLITLIFPTQFWPQAWGGMWIFQALMATALLPALAMSLQGIKIATSK
jgi:hypothetical protein